MSNELEKLNLFIEANLENYFLKGDLKELEELLNGVFENSQGLDLNSQKELFALSMSCYPLFSYSLDRDLNSIPRVLRYCLISKSFFRYGITETPSDIYDVVKELLDQTEQEWYSNDEVGYRIFNLRERVLRNPTLDLEILNEEFYNTGDNGNLSAILNNPKCPIEFIEQIATSDHPIIFTKGANEELVNEAKEILASRSAKEAK